MRLSSQCSAQGVVRRVHAIEAEHASQLPRVSRNDQLQLSRNDAASLGGIFGCQPMSLVGLLRLPPVSATAPLLAVDRTPSAPDQNRIDQRTIQLKRHQRQACMLQAVAGPAVRLEGLAMARGFG
jgi:hypothetical protein